MSETQDFVYGDTRSLRRNGFQTHFMHGDTDVFGLTQGLFIHRHLSQLVHPAVDDIDDLVKIVHCSLSDDTEIGTVQTEGRIGVNIIDQAVVSPPKGLMEPSPGIDNPGNYGVYDIHHRPVGVIQRQAVVPHENSRRRLFIGHDKPFVFFDVVRLGFDNGLLEHPRLKPLEGLFHLFDHRLGTDIAENR